MGKKLCFQLNYNKSLAHFSEDPNGADKQESNSGLLFIVDELGTVMALASGVITSPECIFNRSTFKWFMARPTCICVYAFWQCMILKGWTVMCIVRFEFDCRECIATHYTPEMQFDCYA